MSVDEHGNSIEHPDFRVKEHLASGGMGAVLEVEEATTLRPVALKVMHPNAMQSDEAQRRFMLEAQVMARLEHPNIVPMHVLKRDAEGKPFYTMKKVVGRDLQQIISAIRKGNLRTAEDFPLARLLQIFQKICDAIGYAHSKGVVHRDLKPANVMVGEFGEVLVMDWGLAKIIGQDEDEPSIAESTDITTELSESQLANSDLLDVGAGLTMDGALMGTPQFMAPEQAEGRVNEIDGRTDVWALGGILYAILTLHPPITGKSLEELLSKVRTGEIAPPTVFNSSRAAAKQVRVDPNFKLLHCPSLKIPAALSAIVKQAMQVEPDHRYPTAEDLREDVEAWQNGYATAAERAGMFKELALLLWRHKLAAIGACLIIALAVGFGLRVRDSQLQTENALVELRSAIPLFIADIDDLIAAEDYEAAHERLDQCIKMIPDRSSFYVKKGQLHQSSLMFDEALEQFNKALEIAPDDDAAMDELTFTRRLAKSSDLTMKELNELSEHLVTGDRFTELGMVSSAVERIRSQRQRELEDLRRKIINDGSLRESDFRLTSGTGFGLHIERGNIRTLEFLKGMPLRTLVVQTTNALDLKPLQGMPLEILRFNSPAITDYSPLEGMKLKDFQSWNSRARDFGVLAGMPLESVAMGGCNLTSIEFLKECPLQYVHLSGNPALADFSPLAGKKIGELWIASTAVTNLDFVRDMPLKALNLDNTAVADLTPAKGAPLQRLFLNATRVTDLSPLAGAPLTELWGGGKLTSLNGLQGAPLTKLRLGGKQIFDLSPLRDSKMVDVGMGGTSIRDLRPLAGQPIQQLDLAGTQVTDLRPLAGMPIRSLQLHNNPYLSKLNGLEQCQRLAYITLPKRQLNLDPIRNLPNLKKLVYGPKPNNDWNRVAPVEQYWPTYDKWRRTRVFK